MRQGSSTSTRELAGLASSKSIVPVTPLKMPRTFVIIMCLPVKLTTVCAGSSCQVLIVLPLLLLSHRPAVSGPVRM